MIAKAQFKRRSQDDFLEGNVRQKTSEETPQEQQTHNKPGSGSQPDSGNEPGSGNKPGAGNQSDLRTRTGQAIQSSSGKATPSQARSGNTTGDSYASVNSGTVKDPAQQHKNKMDEIIEQFMASPDGEAFRRQHGIKWDHATNPPEGEESEQVDDCMTDMEGNQHGLGDLPGLGDPNGKRLPRKFSDAYEEVRRVALDSSMRNGPVGVFTQTTPSSFKYEGRYEYLIIDKWGFDSLPEDRSFEFLPKAQGPYDDILFFVDPDNNQSGSGIDKIPKEFLEQPRFKKLAYLARLNEMMIRMEPVTVGAFIHNTLPEMSSPRKVLFCQLVQDKDEVPPRASLEEIVDGILNCDRGVLNSEFIQLLLQRLTFGKSNEDIAYIMQRCVMKVQQIRLSKVIHELQPFFKNNFSVSSQLIAEQMGEFDTLHREITDHNRQFSKSKRKTSRKERVGNAVQ